MHEGIISEDIRPEILSSWHRCERMKVDYKFGKGTRVSNEQLEESIAKNRELINLTRPIMENVFEVVKETYYSVVLTDEKGIIIDQFTIVRVK